MNKENCTVIELAKGSVRAYDFGEVTLHAYQTRDLIDDEVFVLERDGRGVVIEYPCFKDNIAELEAYIGEKGIEVEGILAAYHMAGGTFLEGTPVYATAEADAYGHVGGGKALIDNFTAAFGEAFDATIPTVTNLIEGGELEIAGMRFVIVPNHDAFDIEIPQANAVYTHMLGHDCHSIVAGDGHAAAIIGQLEGYKAAGLDLVLTSHYVPEDLKDVQTKIDYLSELRRIAGECADGAQFKQRVQEEYPEYAGENYLDMTCGFFFAE